MNIKSSPKERQALIKEIKKTSKALNKDGMTKGQVMMEVLLALKDVKTDTLEAKENERSMTTASGKKIIYILTEDMIKGDS